MDGGPSRQKDFCIPRYILDPEVRGKVERSPEVVVVEEEEPSCPVVVFINPRSGAQLGAELLKTYRELLNEDQVFDLGERDPENVLRMLFENLERLRQSGDHLSDHILNNLKLIVAGGDGTAGWLLSVVCDLNLTRPPPIATVPLGTGNNLPFAFGWGKRNPSTDRESVKSFLVKVKAATPKKIDNWHIFMKMKSPEAGSSEFIAPHPLHKFRQLPRTDKSTEEGFDTFRGGFWNYFSIGMDAQVSYAFHSERKAHPQKFKNQLSNQRTYARLGIKQGWFLPSPFHDQSSNLSKLLKVKILRRPDSGWETFEIHRRLGSVIIQLFLDFHNFLPWISSSLHRVHRIKFEFNNDIAKEIYMRLDGEPWKQPLPNDTVVIDISHHGKVTMLATRDQRSWSCKIPPLAASSYDHGSDDNSRERKKFGAADSFKMPEDISYFS